MKHGSGFSLLEVLLSLTILVSAVAIFSSLHFRSLMRVWKGREQIEKPTKGIDENLMIKLMANMSLKTL